MSSAAGNWVSVNLKEEPILPSTGYKIDSKKGLDITALNEKKWLITLQYIHTLPLEDVSYPD